MKTLVYIDHFKGTVQPASWEVLGVAKGFGTAIAAVFGTDVGSLRRMRSRWEQMKCSSQTARRWWTIEPKRSQPRCLRSLLHSKADLILLPTTTRTREMAAMAAIDLKTGVLVDLSVWPWWETSWRRCGRSTKASSPKRSFAPGDR